MANATDELRRMLDERGVEWSASSDEIEHVTVTRWLSGGNSIAYVELNDGFVGYEARLIISGLSITPEQAIAATLGGAERTCRWEYPQGVNGWVGYTVCSSCGEKYDETVTDMAHYCPNCGAKVVK